MIFNSRLMQILFLGLSVSVLGACFPRPRLAASFLANDRPAGSVEAVAEDLAQTLAAAYPPGRTAFFLSRSDDPKDDLGAALETALRARGFTLAPEAGPETPAVSYVLDRAGEGRWYSKLAVSGGLTATRAYEETPEGLTPAAAARTGEVRFNEVRHD